MKIFKIVCALFLIVAASIMLSTGLHISIAYVLPVVFIASLFVPEKTYAYMAIVQNTLIGHARKKIGNAVFATLKGQNILKSKPLSVAQPVTDKKTMRQSAMRQIVAIYRANAAAIRNAYTPNKQKQSEFNSFTSDNLKNAFDYSAEPVATLIPADLVFGKGTMSNTALGEITSSAAAHTLSVAHSQTVDGPGQALADVANLFVYNTTKSESASDASAGARSAATATMTIPSNWAAADAIIVYLSFSNGVDKTSGDSTSDTDVIGA